MRSVRPGPLLGPIVMLLSGAVLAPPLEGQTFRSEDPVLRQMWVEGMERSSAGTLAQVLTDSIGPRLSGSPGFEASADWLLGLYESWGVAARREEYGTWRGWRQGPLHADLVAPRIQTLEAELLAWSPGTAEPVEAETVLIPELGSAAAVDEWLPTVAGKIVLASPPEPTCREPQALERLALPETVESLQAEREELRQSWSARLERLGPEAHRLLEDAGAVAVVTSRWSEGWGVNKIFSAQTAKKCCGTTDCG